MSNSYFDKTTCSDLISKINSIDAYKLPDDINQNIDSHINIGFKDSETWDKMIKEIHDKENSDTQNTINSLRDGIRQFIEEKNDSPKQVIFNSPATIVYWNDGTKSVAKLMGGDTYDPEIGLMVCYLDHFAPDNWKRMIKRACSKEFKQAKKVKKNGVAELVWIPKPKEVKNVEKKSKGGNK